MYIAGKRYEWHPAIRAMAWALDWAGLAVNAAVLIEFLVSGREILSHPARIGARAAVISAAIVLSMPLLPCLEMWWSLVQHVRRNYGPNVSKALVAVHTGILLIVGVYALLLIQLLPRMWRRLDAWASTIDVFDLPKLTWTINGWTIALLLAGCALTAWMAVRFSRPTFRLYGECIRNLGVRHVLRGVAMMTFFRLRQPRRDFFKMAPVIADLFLLTICVTVYLFLPPSVFSTALVWILVAAVLVMSLSRIRPPTWLFLATSDYEAFWVFFDLRQNWGLTAVCLLDRGTPQGYQFYEAEREMWSRERGISRNLFYDPSQPRVWNLRTRPDLWEHTVLLLIDYVRTVVVDLRQPSDYVLDEVKWLMEPSRIGKALFLVDEKEGLLPEYAAAIPESARDRVMTGYALYALGNPTSR